MKIKTILFLLAFLPLTMLPAADERVIRYTGASDAEYTVCGNGNVIPGKTYRSTLRLTIDSVVPGAVMNCEIIQLDKAGREVARNSSDWSLQRINAAGTERKIAVEFKAADKAENVKLQLNYGGNPVTFRIHEWELAENVKKAYFKGIYNDPDPYPVDRIKALEAMKNISPAAARVEKRNGRPALIVDGKPLELNAYKGHYDFSKFGESGGDLVISFNCGQRLYTGAYWDKALWDPATGTFDYSAIENNLLRIHQANPRAKVILNISIDPLRDYLEKHPENILLNSAGVRGKIKSTAFGGWSNAPLEKGQSWAWSYFGKELQEHIAADLKKLALFLRSTPAGNIVIGFKLSGGHDGQFIQWEYNGLTNGHFDYSPAGTEALREYLKEIYPTDTALQKAWDDPEVTLKSARNPTAAEFNRMKFADDRPGLGRKIADCRRFIAVGTARMLNKMASVLKEAWQRPAVVQVWYSTAIWAYPSRLALDELAKNGAVNIIGMVTNYAPSRSLDGPGGSANSCIQALNIRNLLYIQEMDHRTWRTERTSGYFMNMVAFPSGPAEFRSQLMRDAASVLALGGQGFYLYDMFGSWYNDPAALDTIRTIFAMNNHVSRNAGKFPHPRAAIFMDEATRLMSEYVPNYVSDIWRISGFTPALHFLSDLTNPELPEYDLGVLWSPLTIDKKQLAAVKKMFDRPGKVLVIVGDAGRTSREFSGTVDVLARLGLETAENTGNSKEAVIPAPGVKDPVLKDVLGVMEQCGSSVHKGRLNRKNSFGFTVIDDPAAKILGVYEKSGEPAFAVKKMSSGGTLFYMSRNGALTSQMLHNFAIAAGIKPFSKPGNAVFVGNGVAAVHRLTPDEPVIDFGRDVALIEPVSGKILQKVRIWKPQIKVGECAAVCYLPDEKNR